MKRKPMAGQNSWADKYLKSDHHSDREVHNKTDITPTYSRRISSSYSTPYYANGIDDEVRVIINDDVEPDISIPGYASRALPAPVAKSSMQVQLAQPRSYRELSRSNYDGRSYSLNRRDASPAYGATPSIKQEDDDPVMSYYRRRSIAPDGLAHEATSRFRRKDYPPQTPTLNRKSSFSTPNLYTRRPSIAENSRFSSGLASYTSKPSYSESRPLPSSTTYSSYRRPSISDPCLESTRRPSVTILTSPSLRSFAGSRGPSVDRSARGSSRAPSVERYQVGSYNTFPLRSRNESPMRSIEASRRSVSRAPTISRQRQSSLSRYSGSRAPSAARI